jgi:hypothetical protein
VKLFDLGRRASLESSKEAMQFAQFAIDHVSDAGFWMGPDARLT